MSNTFTIRLTGVSFYTTANPRRRCVSGLIRFVCALKKIDELVFGKRIRIKFVFYGKPQYNARYCGDRIIGEYYTVPIFYPYTCPYYGPESIAVHEVRHRVQLNYPEIRLMLPADNVLPNWLRAYLCSLQPEETTPREIDALICEWFARPVLANFNTNGLLEILFRGVDRKSPK